MAASRKTLRVCERGHEYYKSSSCPVCPICEKLNAPEEGFLSKIAAPARRALENAGIQTLKQLSKLSEKELLMLHGMGPSSIPKLKAALESAGLSFKQ